MPIDRKYTGYYDSDASGYIGVRANIDYIAPESVCNQTNTWIGLDDIAKMVWVQIGWASEKQPEDRKAGYAEVHRHDGGYQIVYSNPLVGGVTYKIRKNDDRAIWSIADTVIHEESWSGIVGDGVLPRAVYTVEVFDASCDYVPGSSTNKNYYKTIQTQVLGGEFAKAALTDKLDTDPNGNVERIDGDTMDMAVWDTRAGATMSKSTRSENIPMQEATPSLSWEGFAGRTDMPAPNMPSYTSHDMGGLEPDISWVRLSDQFSFGAAPTMNTGMISLEDIPLHASSQDNSVSIDIFVEAEHQAIVTAATRTKAQWVKPSPNYATADPEATLRNIGIEPVFDPSVKPKMKVEDVLAAIASGMGVSAPSAGQIVMRPRMLAPTYPKSEKQGKMSPDRARGLYWIVEVRGTLVHQIVSPNGKHMGHQTGMIILVDDTQGDAFYGISLT